MSTRMTAVSVTLALLGAMGCGGDSASGIYIKQWRGVPDEITVGTTTPPLSVELSRVVTEKTWVDVENTYLEFVKVDPADFLTYKVDEQKHDITLKGLKASPGKITVKFTVRLATGQTKEFREMEFRVVSSSTVDSGPLPDQGPKPDKPLTLDKTTTPDKGPTPDQPSPDK